MKLTNQPHVPDEFDELVLMMQTHLETLPGPWFTAQVDLRSTYMALVPERQWHDCRCCKDFVYRYGDMYTYVDGVPMTLWSFPGMPIKYAKLCMTLDTLVLENIKDEDPLHTFGETLGSETTGQFTHFKLHTVPQLKATADHYWAATERMKHALANGINYANLAKLKDMAVVNNFPRQDKLMPQLEWLLKYCKANVADKRIMLAQAHDGLTHPRTTIVGLCIEAMPRGADEVQRVYSTATDTFNYQRPTVAPKARAIAAAEKLFAEMGLASALERRPVTVADIPEHAYLWKPAVQTPRHGIFGHLKSVGAQDTTAAQVMTWAFFKKNIMPLATSMRWVSKAHCLTSLTTAVHPNAKPILRWDSESNRNPVAWWIPGTDFAKPKESLIGVRGILQGVPAWTGDSTLPHDLVYLEDTGLSHRTYSGLFPECLRHELHSVRSVIEAHNLEASFNTPEPHPEATAIRASLVGPNFTAFTLKVKTLTSVFLVTIDRAE